MTDYQDYITFDECTLDDCDEYGAFVEYSVFVCNEIKQLAHEQFSGVYVPSEESYIDYYLRRYEDGSTRIWLGIHEDFTTTGLFEEGLLALPEDLQEIIDSIPID